MRFGAVRPAERGWTRSTCVNAVDAGAIVAVASEVPSVWVAATSPSPASVSAGLPSARTETALSVAAPVKAFVRTRSYSTCSSPSLPNTAYGRLEVSTCSAVVVLATAGIVPRTKRRIGAAARAMRRSTRQPYLVLAPTTLPGSNARPQGPDVPASSSRGRQTRTSPVTYGTFTALAYPGYTL